jgi:acyl-CoA thioesterase
LISLKKVDNKHFRISVEPKVCTPVDFLYGGASLGIAIKALELQTERPAIWASAQFVSYAHPGDILDLFVEEVSVGHKVTQARVKASVKDKEIFFATASLGSRNNSNEGQWVKFPDVLPVSDCDPHKLPLPDFGDKVHIHTQQDYLLPFNEEIKRPDDKHIVWVNVRNAEHNDASTLSVIADMATASGNYVLKKRVGGSSLDNTIRIVKLVPTEWVLFDTEVQGIFNGIATCSTKLWSQDKQLLAVASQSFIVREFG